MGSTRFIQKPAFSAKCGLTTAVLCGRMPMRVLLGLCLAGRGISAVGQGPNVIMRGRVSAAGTDSFTMTDGSGAAIKVCGTAYTNDFVRARGKRGPEPAGAGAVPVLRARVVHTIG